jgi:hypothetical protein
VFERALAFVGYVPASEASERLSKMLDDLTLMTAARDELARLHTTEREQRIDLQARYDNLAALYETDIRTWETKEAEWQSKEAEHAIALEQLDAANSFIALLQSERPQMRLMRPESETRGTADEEAEPLEDEIIVKEHTVVLTARLIIVSLEGKTFWTLSINDSQFRVAVHDKDFFENTRPICRGTVIRAEFLETTFRRRADNEPYVERTLERVLELIPPSPQTTESLFGAQAASERN